MTPKHDDSEKELVEVLQPILMVDVGTILRALTAARPIIERKVAERIVRWLWFSDDPIAVLSDVSVKFNLDLADPKDGGAR